MDLCNRRAWNFLGKRIVKDKSKFHIEIVIKKDNKLHAKSNGFVNSINDHIDKKYYDVKIRYYKQPDRLEKVELDLPDYAKKGLTQEKQQMLIRQNLLRRLIQLASNQMLKNKIFINQKTISNNL